MDGLYLSLEGENPDIITHDNEEYTVVEDTGAMLIDEQNVLDVFGDEVALECIKMESLYALESIIRGKTLSATAAGLLQLAAPVDIRVPALEHFKNPYVAPSVTTIATEGIIGGIWKAIKKIVKSIIDFFSRLFGFGKGGKGGGKSKLNNIAKDFEETINRTNENLNRIQQENMQKFKDAINGVKDETPYTGPYEIFEAKFKQDIDGKNLERLRALGGKVPKDIIGKVISGPMDVLAFAVSPNEKIEAENMHRNLDIFKRIMDEVTKSANKITPAQKTIDKLKAYVDDVKDGDIDAHKSEITKLVEQFNKDLKAIIEDLFYSDKNLFGSVVGFSPYFPGVLRYGVELTKGSDPLSVDKVKIKLCIDTDLSHIPGERCFIRKPSGTIKEKLDRLNKVSNSFHAATNSAKGVWEAMDKSASVMIKALEPILDEEEPNQQDSLAVLKRNAYGQIVSANRSIGAIINDYILKIPTEYGYILSVYKKYLD